MFETKLEFLEVLWVGVNQTNPFSGVKIFSVQLGNETFEWFTCKFLWAGNSRDRN